MSSMMTEETYLAQDVHKYRLRHIISVQIRNFTPFPIRDVVTSSLAAVGPAPLDYQDDTDLTLSRRRSRRISTNSLSTLRGLRTDGVRTESTGMAGSSQVDLSPGRPRANSRPIRKPLPVGFPQRPQRDRTVSSASTQSLSKTNLYMPYDSPSLNAADIVPPSPIAPNVEADEYQRSLERVVASRLVETFMCLEAWKDGDGPSSNPLRSKNSTSPVRLAGSGSERFPVRLRSGSTSSTFPSTRNYFQPITPQPSQHGVSAHDTTANSSSSPLSKSRPTLPSTSESAGRLSPRIHRHEPVRSNTVSTSHALPTPAPSPPPCGAGDDPLDCAPFYISQFHAPSTNPSFASLDAGHDFAPWADLGSHRFRASLWGNAASNWGNKLKPAEVEDDQANSGTDGVWEVLASWDVDMDELVPLTSDPLLLPSNTLVLRLAPDGDAFYLPPNRLMFQPTRPPSPTAGYSDTEIDYEGSGTSKRIDKESFLSRGDVLNRSLRETKMKKSAGFGDLLKLVTLHSVIADTRIQLDEIIDECDRLLGEDASTNLYREISEREEGLRSRKDCLDALILQNTERRKKLQEKRTRLRKRAEKLEKAREMQLQDSSALNNTKDEVNELRSRHAALSVTLQAVRTTLLQTVALIFPIEPIEPRDLLFGIISVPLPIPTGANDPAPPLTLPNNSSYNEDTMASALGFVAQVIYLISVYLGELPVYPIKCLGSRSMVKDPISAMMGPRTFPLYARGVEPYRFEYGVFLLNKNIEILMGERNLRALDLRQTLPNLKNLLLTLTSGETVVLKPKARKKSSILPNPDALSMSSSISASDPPTRTASPVLSSERASESESSIQIEPTLPTTPTASKVVIEPDPEQITEDLTPTNSTLPSSTPAADKTDTATVKKSFYSPLAALLRTRYPSVRAVPNPSSSSTLNVKVEAILDSSDTGNISPATKSNEVPQRADADETSTIRGRKDPPSATEFSPGPQ